MIVYRVYDTLKSVYWSSPKGKTVWVKSSHAKNAVNVSYINMPQGKLRFNDPNQTRYVIHQFELIRIIDKVED